MTPYYKNSNNNMNDVKCIVYDKEGYDRIVELLDKIAKHSSVLRDSVVKVEVKKENYLTETTLKVKGTAVSLPNIDKINFSEDGISVVCSGFGTFILPKEEIPSILFNKKTKET